MGMTEQMLVSVMIGAKLDGNFKAATGEAMTTMQRMTATAKDLASRMISLPSIALGHSMFGAVENAIAWDKALVSVRKNADMTAAQTEILSDKLTGMASGIGQSRNQLLEGFGTLSQRGMEAKDIDQIISTIGKAATASEADIKDLATTSDVLIRTLGIKPEGLQNALDDLYYAGKLGNVELKDSAKFLPNLANQMINLGVTGREAADTIAVGLQTIAKGSGDPNEAFTNMSNVLQKMTSKESRTNLQKITGISVKTILSDAEKSGQNPLEAYFLQLKKAIDATPNDVDKKMLLSDVFTDMQMQNGITAAIHNLDYFIETMNDLRAGKAQGTIDKDVDITMLSVSKRAEMAMNQLKALSGQIGSTLLPVINGIATITKPFLQVFGWIADHFPKMTAALVLGLGAAYIVGGQRTMAFIRAIMGIAPAAASSAAAVRNLAGATGQLAAAETAATAATMRNNAVRQLSNAQALQAAGIIRGGKIGAMMEFGGSALGFAQRNGARLGLGAFGLLAAGSSYAMADKTGETEAETTQKKRDAAGDLIVNTASAVAMALGPVGIAVGAALQVTDAIVKGTTGNSIGHYASRMVTRDEISGQDKASYIASIADPNFDFAKHAADFKARKAREEQVKNGKIDAGGTINVNIDHKNAFVETKTNDPRMDFKAVYRGRVAMAEGF